VILSPSVRQFLTALALNTPDYTTLASLMVKPANAVMMSFSPDPTSGLPTDRFSGSAVVFVSTADYSGAALQ
jgi:hypothetical protein